MKRAPAVYLTSEPVDHAAAQGSGMVLRALRYYPGQELYILNPETNTHRRVRILTATSGPIESLSRAELEPVGFGSRGAVLDALEASLESDTIGLDAWVTILTWEDIR